VLLPCRFSALRLRQSQSGGASIGEEAMRLLLRLGIAEHLHDRPEATLSVSEKQLVTAGRAMIGRATLLIANCRRLRSMSAIHTNPDRSIEPIRP
jgi:putative ABC transport system ATP-binding protein